MPQEQQGHEGPGCLRPDTRQDTVLPKERQRRAQLLGILLPATGAAAGARIFWHRSTETPVWTRTVSPLLPGLNLRCLLIPRAILLQHKSGPSSSERVQTLEAGEASTPGGKEE